MDVVDVLRELGMSKYESFVLYTLFRVREADARKISDLSGVPRTKIYEILANLVSKGYVVEKDGKPKLYSVNDPKKTIMKIIEEKEKELNKLKTNVNEISVPLLQLEKPDENDRYIIKAREIDDFTESLQKKGPLLVGYTLNSLDAIKNLPGKKIKTPFDIILSEDAVYLPLNGVCFPEKDLKVAVFKDPGIVDVFRRWFHEREDL